MPPEGIPYTLVGFAEDLDWRPLRFVKPIPGNKLCRACGLVCRRTAQLPCLHLLCELCYEQCAQDGERVCPLDEQHCRDEEVDWKETPAEEILRREVKCWNEGNGCAVLITASEICRHFQRGCEHHSVACPKCSATVVRSDVCAHLRSDCRALVAPVASECEEQFSLEDEKVIFSSFRRALQQQACEMRAYLEHLPIDRGIRDDRFNEICHSMNTLNETLRQELTALKESTRDELTRFTETLRHELAAGRMSQETSVLKESLRRLPELMRKSQESFETNMSQIVAYNQQVKECLIGRKSEIENLAKAINSVNKALKDELVIPTKHNTEKLAQIADAVRTSRAEVKERTEKTLDWTKELLWMSALHEDHCVFFVRGVEALKEAARKECCSHYFHETLYLRGYGVSPGVGFIKQGDSVTLNVVLQLHKGEMDDSVTWPFAYNIKLSVIHPEKDAKCEIIVRPPPLAKLERPVSSSNKIAWFSNFMMLEDLARDGYVRRDRIRVMWQLLL